MKRLHAHVVALLSAALLATPAQAITLDFLVDITKAVGGNPVGAVLGTGIPGGSGNTGTTNPTGVGSEEISFQPASSGVGAFLALLIGTEIFDELDDIEGAIFTDIPSVLFSNGAFVGLDFVVIFEMVAGDPVSKQYSEADLGQDTSEFTDTPHYVMEFDEASADFFIALITGFEQVFDPEEGDSGLDVLRPVFGQGTVVEGSLSVPEPAASALLLCAGAVLAGARRAARTRSRG